MEPNDLPIALNRKNYMTRAEALVFLKLRSRNSIVRLEDSGVFHPVVDKDGRTMLIPRVEVETYARCREALGRRAGVREITMAFLEAIKDPRYLEGVYAHSKKIQKSVAKVALEIEDDAAAERERQAYERTLEARAERRLRALLEDVPDLGFDDLPEPSSSLARKRGRSRW